MQFDILVDVVEAVDVVVLANAVVAVDVAGAVATSVVLAVVFPEFVASADSLTAVSTCSIDAVASPLFCFPINGKTSSIAQDVSIKRLKYAIRHTIIILLSDFFIAYSFFT